jgi:hypothetical protein
MICALLLLLLLNYLFAKRCSSKHEKELIQTYCSTYYCTTVVRLFIDTIRFIGDSTWYIYTFERTSLHCIRVRVRDEHCNASIEIDLVDLL